MRETGFAHFSEPAALRDDNIDRLGRVRSNVRPGQETDLSYWGFMQQLYEPVGNYLMILKPVPLASAVV
jgi:hypothetical protein